MCGCCSCQSRCKSSRKNGCRCSPNEAPWYIRLSAKVSGRIEWQGGDGRSAIRVVPGSGRNTANGPEGPAGWVACICNASRGCLEKIEAILGRAVYLRSRYSVSENAMQPVLGGLLTPPDRMRNHCRRRPPAKRKRAAKPRMDPREKCKQMSSVMAERGSLAGGAKEGLRATMAAQCGVGGSG